MHFDNFVNLRYVDTDLLHCVIFSWFGDRKDIRTKIPASSILWDLGF